MPCVTPEPPTGVRRATHPGRAALVLFLLAIGCGCATTPREPWVVSTDELKERPTRHLDWIGSYGVAAATALDIMQKELGLPPLQARLVFLPDDAAFEAMLLQIGYPAPLARDTSEVMTAIGGHRAVLINQRRMERDGWPRRVSLLAHELGHVLQYELGGGQRGTSAQWLREGFAEWVALRVMEVLERTTLTDVRRYAIVRVRSHGPFDRMPPLADLSSFRDWVGHSRGPAGDVLYDFALLAAIAAIERHGLEHVLRYFALFAGRQEPAANFMAAFGESEAQFERHVRQAVWSGR